MTYQVIKGSAQMTLLPVADQTPVKPAKRKDKPLTEAATIHQTLARYAREAAEIRAQLRKEGKIR